MPRKQNQRGTLDMVDTMVGKLINLIKKDVKIIESELAKRQLAPKSQFHQLSKNEADKIEGYIKLLINYRKQYLAERKSNKDEASTLTDAELKSMVNQSKKAVSNKKTSDTVNGINQDEN